jgi:hypothetical protein
VTDQKQRAAPLVSRRYGCELDACMNALKLLLKSNRRSEKGGRATNRPRRPEGDQDDRDATGIIPSG